MELLIMTLLFVLLGYLAVTHGADSRDGTPNW
jgi:hypothetical protein